MDHRSKFNHTKPKYYFLLFCICGSISVTELLPHSLISSNKHILGPSRHTYSMVPRRHVFLACFHLSYLEYYQSLTRPLLFILNKV